jgi:hypothetical protein
MGEKIFFIAFRHPKTLPLLSLSKYKLGNKTQAYPKSEQAKEAELHAKMWGSLLVHFKSLSPYQTAIKNSTVLKHQTGTEGL